MIFAFKIIAYEVVEMTGSDVKELRKSLGVSQTTFWKQVHVTQSGGSRYEGGRKIPPSMRVLLILAYGTDEEAKIAINDLRKNQNGVVATAKSVSANSMF